MTVIGALSSFRELGEMSPHKRASVDRTDSRLRDARGDSESGSDRPSIIKVQRTHNFRSSC